MAKRGTVGVKPFDIPEVGRFSVIGDAQHAYTSPINFVMGDPTPQERPAPGTFCWEQLNTGDIDGSNVTAGRDLVVPRD